MIAKPVRSASGGVAVVTTDRGLPIRVKIDSGEMCRDAEDLAREILLLCRVSASRQQVARRRSLESSGVAPAVVDRLGLADAAELLAAEAAVFGEDEPPVTWSRSS
ncbi:hypothetical protein [Mycolicibacterium arenosum]|uniref:Uncharacterized protein n=1 Tax=Mycolicibacterium arenosum TaxID=2952157 RepID=A0ABT1LXA9_9MYCO|nr:hypothetical protein [Mycolicibacterium sp. CAU 1645]MCP9271538.1 hypothetical protein [Mycolicibacterium sp. CAU 1645]